MRNIIGLLTVVLFFFCTIYELRAADSSPVKSGSAAEEFKNIQKKYNALNAELRILQMEYRKAPKDKRPELEKKWKELFPKGEELQAEYFQAAEKAYVEAPNADKELLQLLSGIFDYQIANDDFENVARLGKLLIDNGNGKKRGFAMMGVAAASTGDFKSAAAYFAEAKKQGAFAKPPDEKDTQMQNALQFSQTLPGMEEKWAQEQKIREAEAKADDLPRVRIKTTKGDIVVELFENEAPNTVANFIALANTKVGEKNYYDGVAFHRVLPGFMAQGGDPSGDGSGGPGYTIPDEVTAPNHRNHFRGTLSMAKTDRPNSGGSQFFLCFVPTPQLDGKHTVFGRVVEGLDVLSKIQRRDPTDPNAADPDKIIGMEVLRKRDHDYKVKKTGE
jgi:cyclophilin family peptidyl-prolyl cis-trans isomerase